MAPLHLQPIDTSQNFTISSDAVVEEASTPLSEEKPQFRYSRQYPPTRLADNLQAVTVDVRHHEKIELSSAVKEEKKEELVSIDRRAAVWKKNLVATCPVHRGHHNDLVTYIDSRSNDRAASLLLITGHSGAGKTRLAKSIREPVEARGGYFLTGKFNQRQQLEPYIAFVSAFTEFTNAVVKKGDKVVEKTREAIVQAIGDDKEVLIGMIPALERILGKDDGLARRSKSGDAVQRFVFVFRMFLKAVSSPRHPVVLLLDDLHWADPCSVDLLANIVVEMTYKGLVIMATCDANVSPDSYLSHKLREIENVSRVSITNMFLRNMCPSGVDEAVALILGRNQDECRSLAQVVRSQTDGRPFFMSEFLRWLEDSGLLYVDRSTGFLSWNEDDIRLAIDTRLPGQFLSDRLKRLPCKIQDVLKVASCLGTHVEKALIEYALGHSIDCTLSEMQGVLVYDEFHDVFTFAHDELQQISYQLISEGDREQFHLEIGRRIWRALDQGGVDRYIFVILSQLAVARRIITRENERISTAFLCLQAGKKAAKASTFRTAAFYLSLGIELVGDRGWRDEYHLTLALHNAGAEMEMIVAEYERAEAFVNAVISRARSDLDKVQAYVTQISILSSMARQDESLDLGIEVLQKFDEHFPKRLCSARLLSEMRSVKRLLKDKSDEQILRIPLIEDEQKIACCQILHQMFFSAMCTRPALQGFIALKSVKLAMNYGLSNFSAAAFSTYGIVCISALGNVDEGYRFGELGLKLLDKFGSMEHLARVYAAHYGVIHSWKKPVQDALGPLQKAAQVGAQTGDIEFSSLCAHCFMKVSSASSRNLGAFLKSYVDIQKIVIARRQERFVQTSSCHVQAAQLFMGSIEYPLPAKDDMFYGQPWNPAQFFVLNSGRMWVAYIFNDFEEASLVASHVTDFGSIPPTVMVTDAVFYSGLVAVANARLGRNRHRNIAIAEKHLKLLRKWSQAAPFNYGHKKCLVEAELASLRKQNAKALEKYTFAIALATKFDFTLELALANERAAQHLVRIGDTIAAEPYYGQACLSYEQWGGQAKLVRLKREIAAVYHSQS